MQVTAAQIRKSVNAKYTLWDGEMVVRVMQNTGAHGFHSAAIVVERCDSPLEVRSEDWYDHMYAGQVGKDKTPMLNWIASQLTDLSTGKMFAEGTECKVEGLLG